MYFVERKLHLNDLDPRGEMALETLLSMMHTAADEQMTGEGASNSDVLRTGHGFILSSLAIRVYEPTVEHETVRVYSWPCESHGYVFLRCYRAMVGEEVRAEGMTRWALVDRGTRKLLPVDRAGIEGYTMGEALDLGFGGRIILPHDLAFSEVEPHRVRFSETDYNRHMNNVRYINMLLNRIPCISERPPRGVEVRWRGEAPLYGEIMISSANVGREWYFMTSCDGHPNVDARVTLGE